MEKQKYDTGYALSGGFIKGFAHLGALQALHEYGFTPDIISGVSAGSIIGALYADGNEPYHILGFFDKLSFTDLTLFSIRDHGIFKLDSLVDFLRGHLHARRIEDLKIPMIITATDFDHGVSMHFREGDLAERIAASCCLPILFAPRRIDGVYYVDGGLLMNLPVTTLRPLCRTVVAINVSTLPSQAIDMSFVDIALRSYNLMFQANSILQKEQCDLLIEPQGLDVYGNNDLDKAEEIFGRGYDAAVEALQSERGKRLPR
ncbi:MAG TPA: patatin-like phospholipase family protein [Candidatus Alistipes excrementipullorum]|nr:patatin-like phospholipase family protein [Candidatus Alistipes excrementipullorum]